MAEDAEDKRLETSSEPASEENGREQNGWTMLGPLTAAFAIVTTAAVIFSYRFGEGVIYIGERTVSELSFIEVTGGAAVGVVGALAGAGVAVVGATAALLATLIGLCIAALGLAVGTVVVIGIVTGPLLLLLVIGVLIKRRFWPDVI